MSQHTTKKRSPRKSIKVPAGMKGIRTSPMPRRIDVKLATLASEAPEGDNWFHEVKFDGYRMLCRVEKGQVRFISRTNKSWTKALEPLTHAVAKLSVKQAIFDGEVVAF